MLLPKTTKAMAIQNLLPFVMYLLILGPQQIGHGVGGLCDPCGKLYINICKGKEAYVSHHKSGLICKRETHAYGKETADVSVMRSFLVM